MAVTEIASYVDQFGTSGVSGIVVIDGIAGLDLTPEVIRSSIDFLKTLQTNRSQEASDFVRSDARRAVREAGSTFEME